MLFHGFLMGLVIFWISSIVYEKTPLVEALVSVTRVNKFVTSEDKEEVKWDPYPEKFVKFENLSLRYDMQGSEETKGTRECADVLKDVCLQVQDGQFAVISGKVGSGKSMVIPQRLQLTCFSFAADVYSPRADSSPRIHTFFRKNCLCTTRALYVTLRSGVSF
jgi:ABC-type protease/lipase transport system fused ATPase/permease subunit